MTNKNAVLKFGVLSIFLVSSLFLGVLVHASDTCVCKDSAGKEHEFAASSLCNSNQGGGCGTICTSQNPVQSYSTCRAESKQNESGSSGQKDVTPATVSIPNPLGITDVNQFIANIINFVLSLVGSISLILFIYGGITWMLSAGSPAQVKKGRDIVVWAVIGLAVVFTSYILVRFVIEGITLGQK